MRGLLGTVFFVVGVAAALLLALEIVNVALILTEEGDVDTATLLAMRVILSQLVQEGLLVVVSLWGCAWCWTARAARGA